MEPETFPLLTQALDRIVAVKALIPNAFEDPASEEDIVTAASGIPGGIPEEWQAVLRVADGWEYPHETYYTLIPSVTDLARMQADYAGPRLLSRYKNFATRFLVVGDSECGDIYCLDRARPDGVTGVTLLSHSGGAIEAEWATVAEFLIEVLSDDVVADEDEDDDDDEE